MHCGLEAERRCPSTDKLERPEGLGPLLARADQQADDQQRIRDANHLFLTINRRST